MKCILFPQELSSARIERDHRDVDKLEELLEPLHLFSGEQGSDLFKIASGRALNEEIADELINLYTLGETWMAKFIDECKLQPNRFEEPIKIQQS